MDIAEELYPLEIDYQLDDYGMWIVGDQLFVGYGLVHTVDEIIQLCRLASKYIHTTDTLADASNLLEFAKKINARFIKIKSLSLALSKEVANKRLRLQILRSLDMMNEFTPLLISSVEAYVACSSTNGRCLAVQNRDYFKLKLLEVLRDFVYYLQLVKSGRSLTDTLPTSQVDLTWGVLNWLSKREKSNPVTEFDAIRRCIHEGRQLAALLVPGVDKGELLAVCSECEASTSRLRELYKKGRLQGPDGGTVSLQLFNQLSNQKDRMVEALSRKILDDFLKLQSPIYELEKAALVVHYKPQRDIVFSDKVLVFERWCNDFVTSIDIACHLDMIHSLHKLDTIKRVLAQMIGLSRQLVWAAKLLFSNPYSDVSKDHFTLVKNSWLRKTEQLRSLIMSCAELRTYPKFTDNRSYTTHSIISPKWHTLPSPTNVDRQQSPIASPSKVLFLSPKDQPSWESADKDLVQAARKLAMIMARIVYKVRNNSCTSSELFDSSKEIVRGCDIISRLTRELAYECTDLDLQKSLLKYCERIPTLATQLKMICTIKASTFGKDSGYQEDFEATEMLLENAKNLMSSVRDVVHTAAAASINIRIAANQYYL